jgi:hypothetical protein
VWQGKELRRGDFVCVAAKGLTNGKKWDFGAFFGCVAGKELSGFWLLFTINDIAGSVVSQSLNAPNEEKSLTQRKHRGHTGAERR